jgi:Carboxypeptidase regulatory-like domain/TonB dependent receptor/TonB-dependent Receptor Plug Domain
MDLRKFALTSVLSTSLLTGIAFVMQPITATAQGIITGSISGSVVDPSGAVIPRAQITITDEAKGDSSTTKSEADGNFYFRGVAIGKYKVTIAADGFQQTVIPGLAVTSGNDTSLSKQALKLGSAETVIVEGASTVELDTSQSQVSTSFSSEDIERLPLAGGFDTVAMLIPGMAQTHAENFANTNGVGISSNGERGRSNNFELDGQSNNDNSVTGPQVFFGNPDAVAEIQVIQSNFSAQYGRNMGSVVNYVTKSGTNSIHGSAFEFYNGSWLNSFATQDKNPLFGYCSAGQNSAATGCTVPVMPRSVDNRWGATLGGPILKDKLWAFGSTYFEHTNYGGSPVNSGSQVTPTPAGLTQLANLFPGNAAVATLTNYGPFGTTFGNPQQTPGTATTAPVTTPSGATVNIPESGVTRSAPQSGNYVDQEDLGRLDAQATSKDRFYLRYFYQTSTGLNYEASSDDFYSVPNKVYSVGADWTHTFSNSWLDQLRYSFQQAKLAFEGGSFPTCTITSLTTCPGNAAFGDNTLGFGQNPDFPSGRTVKVTQVQDNASWTHGNQTFLFGGEYDRQNSPNVFLPNYNGAGTFGSLNNFVQQDGSFSLATGNPVIPFTENDWAVYFQDDWKVSSNLTLNLGLRWEFFGQAVNILHNETVARESNPATAIWDTALPLSQRTVNKSNNNYKNFEPRIGFAYNPDFARKLVIRGGYSIGFDPAFYNIFLNIADLGPVVTSAAFPCGGTCLGSGNFTGAGLRATNLASLPLGGNPADGSEEVVPTNFHNPYAQTFYLGVEYQLTPRLLGSARYVGNHTTGNFQNIDANPILLSTQQAFPNAVPLTLCTTATAPGYGTPNCNQGVVNSVNNTAFSVYNALQTSLTYRDFYGFSGSVNYTFSRAIDNVDEIYGATDGAYNGTVVSSQNPLDPDIAERGLSANSFPNVVSVSLVYKVPSLSMGPSLLRRIGNGFNVNSILQYNSGQPYTAQQPNLLEQGLDPDYCDETYALSFSTADTCRLVLSNKRAPLGSVAIINSAPAGSPIGTGPYELSSYLSYIAGYVAPGPTNPAPAEPALPNALPLSSAHWIVNNTDIANQLNNPYPGVGRNTLRGPSFMNLDSSIYKDTKITERINLQLQFNAYNVLNHPYLGLPNTNAFATNPAAGINPFLSTAYNSVSTLAAGSTSTGVRAFTLGAKVQF